MRRTRGRAGDLTVPLRLPGGRPGPARPVAVRAGTTVSGWLDVPDGIDPGTAIPLSVVRGRRPGPVLALVAGTHGYEYTSILALQRLLPWLDPRRLRGALILVHMANPPAFYGRRVYYGPDGKNLNRVYPGKADGTVSERIAAVLTREVIDRHRPKDPAKSGYTANTAILRGKSGLTTESGGVGRTDAESVGAHEAGVLSLLDHLGMLEAP